MGIGPVPAVRKLLATDRRRRSTGIDLVELNEAFAAQVLAVRSRARASTASGSTSTAARSRSGHPIGCSGARIVVTLLHEMARRGARRGLATLCVSGGMGGALLLER